MNLKPSEEELTPEEVKKGLKFMVTDGVATEVMSVLTGGVFLVALAVTLNASNFQIGLMAALPTLGSVFQLVAIYLVYKYANRRAVTIYTGIISRTPLLFIGFIPFLFSPSIAIDVLVIFLFFHNFFACISGCSWGAWVKDIVPKESLGTYFSNRGRIIQIVNVIFSFAVANALDYIKQYYPMWEIQAYTTMFFVGGSIGLIGLSFLSRVPEPKIEMVQQNFFKLFAKPLENKNFKNLLIFSGFWGFAINLAAPFFTVYMLKILGMNLSNVIALTILSQMTNIFFIRIWGRFSDKYSNKSILQICAPMYIACILAWTFTTLPDKTIFTMPLLILIHFFSGIALSGINLSLSNIGLKLAPKGDAIVYLTTKNMIYAFFSAIAPLIGGLFADYFYIRELSWTMQWKGPKGIIQFYTLDLQQWDFFFMFSVILGLIALYRLSFVIEEGEVEEKVIMNEVGAEFMRELKATSAIPGLMTVVYLPISFIQLIRNKVRGIPTPDFKHIHKNYHEELHEE